MFCAAIPVAAAAGAKLNAEQKRIQAEGKTDSPKPIVAITGVVIALLVVGSAIYHSLAYR